MLPMSQEWDRLGVDEECVPPPAQGYIDPVTAGWSRRQHRRPPTPLDEMTPWHQEQARKRMEAEARDTGAPRPKARRKSRTSSQDE